MDKNLATRVVRFHATAGMHGVSNLLQAAVVVPVVAIGLKGWFYGSTHVQAISLAHSIPLFVNQSKAC